MPPACFFACMPLLPTEHSRQVPLPAVRSWGGSMYENKP